MKRTPPRKCAVKATGPAIREEPVEITEDAPSKSTSTSKGVGGKAKFVYPKLSRFCLTKEQLNQEYGLSLVGKLPTDLSKEDFPEADWLSVFRVPCAKNSKIFLHMVRPLFLDDCRLLYQKVYQAVASNNEIGHKFARCFAYERCTSAQSDPEGHRIAWATFGENVLETCKQQPGGLQKKISNWRKAYGPTKIDSSIEDLSPNEGGKPIKGGLPSMEQKTPQSHFSVAVQVPWLRKVEEQVVRANEALSKASNELSSKFAECNEKRDAMLRNEGTCSVAAVLLKEMEDQKQELESLKVQTNPDTGHMQLLNVQIEATSRTLKLLGVDDTMLNAKGEVAVLQVEVEMMQAELDDAKVHLSFTESMLMLLKQGDSLCLVPTPYQAPIVDQHVIHLEGKCAGCGEPLDSLDVVGMYMLPCKHKYHPLCFASLLASRLTCSSRCCGKTIPESALSMLLGGPRLPLKPDRDNFNETSFVVQSTGSAVDKGSQGLGKSSGVDDPIVETEQAAQDGLDAVMKMEGRNEGVQEEMTKGEHEEVVKEGEKELMKEGKLKASKEGVQEADRGSDESDASPDVTLKQLKALHKKKRPAPAGDQGACPLKKMKPDVEEAPATVPRQKKSTSHSDAPTHIDKPRACKKL